MSGPVDVWRQVADKWSEVYAGVADDQWSNATPCDGWDVRQLVDHTLGWQAEGGRLLGAAIGPDAGWAEIRAAYEAVLSDPSQLSGTVPSFGGVPKHDMAGFMIGDLLIHSWDLARSVGADETLPPDAVEATTIGLHHVPPSLLRGTNPLGAKMMGPAVEVADDASAQDQMLGFTGRRP
jgi:trehalose 6-phosphate phosphatase